MLKKFKEEGLSVLKQSSNNCTVMSKFLYQPIEDSLRQLNLVHSCEVSTQL